jgi:hypothetical protein
VTPTGRALGGTDALCISAELISPRIVKWRSASKATHLFAVSGITPDTMADYVRAGATGLTARRFGPGASAIS